MREGHKKVKERGEARERMWGEGEAGKEEDQWAERGMERKGWNVACRENDGAGITWWSGVEVEGLF